MKILATSLSGGCCLALLLGTGCTSVMSRIDKSEPRRVYPGVQADVEAMSDTGHVPAALIYTYCMIDMPFSAVLDTLLWPFDRCHRHTNAEPGAAPNGGPATAIGNSGVTEGRHR